ncbi:hypothetical protein ACEPAI_9535 [Sanghuangporus weigelae]
MPRLSSASIETFGGFSYQSVDKWIDHVETYFLTRCTPKEKQLSFAFQHLSNSVKGCVMSLSSPLEKISGRGWDWDWPRLKVALRGIEKQIKSNNSGAYGGWLRALAVGAMVALWGPLALGMALTETTICTIGAVLLSIGVDKPDSDSKARAIAAEVGKSRLPPVAHETIRQIWWKTPSKSWEDGLKFNPSMELIIELLKMIAPEKNTI